MGTFLRPRQALIMASLLVLVTLFSTTADAKDPKECLEYHLPWGVDLRTWRAKTDPIQRPRLIDSPWILSPLEAPKWVQDPGNGLKSIRGSWGDHLGSISGVLDPFRGL